MAPRFQFHPSDVRAEVAGGRTRWAHLAAPHPTDVPFARLKEIHDAIRTVAVALSGTTHDAPLRAIRYFALYEDSARNLVFPLVASHGSMWGVTHTESIDRTLTPMLRVSRRGRVRRWLSDLDAVRAVNRSVFREVYTTFHFTRYFGHHPRACALIKAPVLALYNRVHEAVATGVPLTLAERRSVYYDVFVHEQGDIVDPGILDAARSAGPLLVNLLKRVSPRFTYFPRRERLWFSDFTNVDQRNREGLRAFEFAEEVGSDRVFEALAEY